MRVVSLIPSATEIVSALGAVGTLVGVTHECNHPEQVAMLPRVTSCEIDSASSPGVIDAGVRAIAEEGRSLCALDEELIRSLHPDVILTQALCDVCAATETDVRALAARLGPAPRVESLSARSLDGVFADISRVAAALSVDDEGEELLAGLRSRLCAVHTALKAARAPRRRVAVLEWTSPVYAAGHWVPEMVRRAGGTDVLAAPAEHSRVVAADEVAAADPDFVIVAPCGFGLERATAEGRKLLDDPAWGFLAARQVWSLDANRLTSRPGPRLVDGIEAMARIFNPALFSTLDDSCAVRLGRSQDTAA